MSPDCLGEEGAQGVRFISTIPQAPGFAMLGQLPRWRAESTRESRGHEVCKFPAIAWKWDVC